MLVADIFALTNNVPGFFRKVQLSSLSLGLWEEGSSTVLDLVPENAPVFIHMLTPIHQWNAVSNVLIIAPFSRFLSIIKGDSSVTLFGRSFGHHLHVHAKHHMVSVSVENINIYIYIEKTSHIDDLDSMLKIIYDGPTQIVGQRFQISAG